MLIGQAEQSWAASLAESLSQAESALASTRESCARLEVRLRLGGTCQNRKNELVIIAIVRIHFIFVIFVIGLGGAHAIEGACWSSGKRVQ